MRLGAIDVRLERRLATRRWTAPLVAVGSLVVALVLGAIFLAATGHPTIALYRELAKAGYFGWYAFTDTLGNATPLIFTGLAAAVCFRMNLYNIGAEGQLYAGAIASSWAGIAIAPGLPGWVAVLVVMCAGAIGGALWVLVPALARAYFHTSEIVSTLLLNYVALYLMQYLIFGSGSYWRDPASSNFPQGKQIAIEAHLPLWHFPTRSILGIDFPPGVTHVHLGLVFAIVAAVLLWAMVAFTRFGYTIRVAGDSPAAARYAGISMTRTVVTVMLMSGALAGLAGAGEVAGRSYALDPAGLALGLGYTGIVIASLARSNPYAVVMVATLLAGLRSGADNMQAATGDLKVSVAVAQVLEGLILLVALGGELFRRNRIVVRRVAPDGVADPDSGPTAVPVAGPVEGPTGEAVA